MWVVNLWRFFQGYLRVAIRGRNAERLVNLAVIRGMGFWGLRKTSRGAVFSLPLKNFKRLRPLAKKTGCRVEIVEKRGFYTWWVKGKKRKGFILGLLFFLASLYAASLFVWFIEVTGTKEVSKEEVIELAGEAGLTTGMYKGHLEVDKIESTMARLDDRIAWVGLRTRGTLVEIEIREHLPEIDRPPAEAVADLVASKDGLVKKVLVLEGEPAVEVGDTVSRGDILIKGERVVKVPQEDGDEEEEAVTERVLPRGAVEARVWYEERVPVEIIETVSRETGNTRQALYLEWGEERFRLSGPAESPFDTYKKEIRKIAGAPEGAHLPLQLVTVGYREIVVEEREVPPGEAVRKAKEKAEKKVLEQIPGEDENAVIENLYWEEVEKENKWEVRFVAETIEDIAEIRYDRDNQ